MININICAIVCEYNPMHEGHKYHLEQARKLTQADYVVCIMSASFVQRGEPAVYNKFLRAETALKNGADMVIELPVFYSLQSAHGFAAGAVAVAKASGICSHLCFGSETGDVSELSAFKTEDSTAVKLLLDSGKSHACAVSRFENNPNDVLAIEYLRALDGQSIIPVAVKREKGITSSDIRQTLKDKNDKAAYFTDDAFFKLVLNELTRLGTDGFSRIAGVNEGLEYRFIKAAETAKSLDELLAGVKCRRYILARLKRILCCALIGITSEHTALLAQSAPYLRVLACKKPELLTLLAQNSLAPVINSPSAFLQKYPDSPFSLEKRATDIYAILSGTLDLNADFTTPLIK